jgi:cytochrome c oxidase cbb3-type subunit 3
MAIRPSRLAVLGVLAGCIGGGHATRPDAGTDAAVAARTPAPTPPPRVFTPPPPPPVVADPENGKKLYGRYCNFCHGDRGQGYAADQAPALANDDLLTIASDEFLAHAILSGRPGTTMSAWGAGRGGPLGPTEAASIVSFLRTWQKRPSEVLDAGAAQDGGDAGVAGVAGVAGDAQAQAQAQAQDGGGAGGDATRGATIYAAKCASCHGAKGQGGKYNALANPELLASASDAFLATTIERGRAGTPMVAFGAKVGARGLADLVALLRSWQKPPDLTLDLPPKPGELKSVVLNPGGPQPAFDPKADFVPIDTVKRELGRKASMVIIDARAPGDYALMHVAGAISVPFYQVDAYAPQIPKDRYILTYCACPHAASVKARNALRLLGYKRVAVLDEGVIAWRDRGYPVRGGAKP